MYEIKFSQDAEKQFKKLENELQKRIINSLSRIIINPENHIERLVGVPYYKLRVGDYRLILDLKVNDSVILVIELGHRKNIYKQI